MIFSVEPRRRRLDLPAPPLGLREQVLPVGAREELARGLGGLEEPSGEDESLFEFLLLLLFEREVF